MSTTPTLNQVHFRVRTDTDLVDNTPTWAAAENVSISHPIETTFRIRFVVQNTGTAASTSPFVLRVSKNAGAYTAVTTSTGATLGAQSDTNASTTVAPVAILTGNFRLTAGAGTANPGLYDEAGSAATTCSNGQYKELEFGLILKTAGAAAGDTFDFRIYNSTTAFTTYTQTPRITVPEASGTYFQPKTPALGEAGNYNSAGRSTYTVTTTAAQAIGDLVAVLYAVDNNATADSDEGAVTAMTDSAGNTYTKAREWTKSTGTAQAGVTTGIWYCQLTSALSAGSTITATFSNSTNRDAVAMTSRSWTVTSGYTVAVEGTNVVTAAGTAPGSLNVTTSNIECLRVRAIGSEMSAEYGLETFGRHTSGWRAFDEISGSSGTAVTSAAIAGESQISTGTSFASNPTAGGTSTNHSSVYVAFRADAPAPFMVQSHSRFRTDTGTPDATPTWGAAEDTTFYPGLETTFRLRFVVSNTGTASSTSNAVLRLSKNSGTYATVTDVTTNGVQGANASTSSSGTAIATQRLTSGTGTWVNGLYSETGSATQTIAAGIYTEVEYGLILKTANLAAGDTLDLRLYRGTNAYETYTQTPRITVPSGPPNDACLANDVSSASSVGQPAVQQVHGVLANDVASPSSVSQPAAVIQRDALANDVTSASSVTLPTAVHVIPPVACLANDVVSASSVTRPTTLRQLQNLLANDVISPSSVKQATALINRVALANDVVSSSSVTQPVQLRQLQVIFVNDAVSPSSVSNPLAGEIVAGGAEPGESLVLTYSPGSQRNDFTGQVGVRIGIGTTDIPIQYIGTRANGYGGMRSIKLYEWFADSLVSSATVDLTGKAEGDWVWVAVTPFTLLANGYYALLMDVVASDGNWWRNPGPVTMQASIVNIYDSYRAGAPLATGGINSSFVGLDLGWDTVADTEDDCLANDIKSTSSVSQPALKQLQATLANDVKSNSAVTVPNAVIMRPCLANDIVSTSKVTNPAVGIQRALLANDVVSPSLVSQAALGSVGGLFANDVVSLSSVGRPTIGQINAMLANDVVSASLLTRPRAAEVGIEPSVGELHHHWIGMRQASLGS